MAQSTQDQGQTQQTNDEDDAPEHELPMLAGIAAIEHWIEGLLNLLAVPVLTIGLCVAVVDLLTGGDLFRTVGWLLYAWAATQAVGLDALLPGCAGNLRRAMMDRRWGAVAGYFALLLMLAAVAFVASLVVSYREVFHTDTRTALAQLGIDDRSLVWLRTAFSVLMAVIAAFLRYRRPRRRAPAASLAEERERLQRELELEPLRQQLRVRQALGGRAVLKAVMRGTNDAPDAPDRDRPPTGPGTPAAAPVVPTVDEPDANPERHPPLPAPMTPAEDPGEWASRPAASGAAVSDLKAARKMAAEAARRMLAFQLLDADPRLSRKKLRTALKCSMNRANELYAAWEYERTRAARSAAR